MSAHVPLGDYIKASATPGLVQPMDGKMCRWCVIEVSIPRSLLRLAIGNTNGHQGSDLEGKRVNEKFAG